VKRGGNGLHVAVRVSERTSGGGRVFANNLVAALASAAGVAKLTVVLLGATASVNYPGAAEVVTVPSAVSAVRRRLGGPQVRNALAGRDVDVLLCPGTELSVVPGVPSVLWPLTVAPFEPQARAVLAGSVHHRVRWLVLRELVRRACAGADGIVYSSHYARAVHEAASPALRDKPSTVIWPPPSLPSGSGQSAQSSLPQAKPYILFVSHLYPYKMVVELVCGFARFAARSASDHHLVLAGRAVDDDYATQIRQAIATEGVADRVQLLGNVDPPRLISLYEGAEFFVFPSISENAGSYALIDALVRGKPVLASFLSSIPEICQDAARYIDPRDPEHVAAGMAALATNSDLRRELSVRAAARAAELPSWNELAAELVSFLTSRVARSAREARV